jgi:thiamine kinase-like enzyme
MTGVFIICVAISGKMGSTDVGEVTIPPWLNYEFLAESLSKEKNKKISVTDMDVKPAVGKGDNYLGTLYRITAEFIESKDGNEVNKCGLIIKTLPPGEILQKLIRNLKGFEKELQMYKVTLPAMYLKMMGMSTNGNFHPLSARYLPTKRKDTIVLEDLQHLGYKMASRHTGLDLEHCKLTVRALARLHAASVALHKADPSSTDLYSESMFADTGEQRQYMEESLKYNLNNLASKLDTWPGYDHYANKIRKLVPTALDQMIKCTKPKEDSLNVLNHGDCWTNNMMFHYCPKTGEVDDVRFVDFQLVRFSSPVLDLQYFLCTSMNDEIRFRQRDRLLREYHAELRDMLQDLGLDPDQYTLQQLNEEFEENDIFGLLIVCTYLSAMLASSIDAPDFSELKEDYSMHDVEHPMDKALEGRRFREVLCKFLHYYEDKGLI